MVLLSTGFPARLSDAGGLTVEQIKAPNHAAVPAAGFDTDSAEDLLAEVAEPAETTDDDETERCLLPFGSVLPLDVPAVGSQAGLYESPVNRALTAFRLRAFSGRGSPSA